MRRPDLAGAAMAAVGRHRSSFLPHLMDLAPQWDLMIKAHSAGFTITSEPDKEIWTLEASMRHIYFEEITHLYNIQRLKRAQSLPACADLPKVFE